MDWDDLESDFAAGESFNPEEFAELSAQDISEMSERPPYEMDDVNPPKLKKIHYHMVKDIDPKLYGTQPLSTILCFHALHIFN